VTIKCPECDTSNPSDSRYCKQCATPLPAPEGIKVTETMEATQEELTTGSTFAERYQIIEELGKGGMGRVYRVLDKKLKEEIALKLIKPEIASDKKTVERFSNELKIARKIGHKNVARMFDLNEEQGTHYITMEYVRGEDLKKLIRKMGPFSAGQAIPIAKQICEGLGEAHRLGVVHRDLKPQNVMVDEGGNARIMDFGIARSLESKGITGAGVMVGTPEYMSPEQVEGKEAGQSSDIYSLGVILYEMVTGRVPFEGDTPFTIGVKHKSEMPKAPKDLNAQIPEDLCSVIMRCLEKDKEKRYQSSGEVRSEMENIQKGIPTTERVVPERKPLTSREITVSFNIKKLLWPTLVILALIVIIAGVFLLRPGREAGIPEGERRSIAVISFENDTGDPAYSNLMKVIPNLLITNLENTEFFHVTTWERMNDILKQMGEEDREMIDKELGFELCRRDGIELIVLGSFAKAGNMFATDAKVLDVRTKELLTSVNSRGESVESILKAQIDELSREIAKGVGIAESKIQPLENRTTDITTSSMEAYSYFIQGYEEFLNWHDNNALPYFEKAVEEDPTFAKAWLYLGLTHGSLFNVGGRKHAIEKAKLYSEKATEKERFLIDAAYAYYIENDREKRIRIIQEMGKKYPKEKMVYSILGGYYQDFEKKIEMFNKALELDPKYGSVLNQLGYLYAGRGDFDKALEYFEKYAAAMPESANPIDSMAELYFSYGKLDEAIINYKKALEIEPSFFDSYWRIPYVLALKEDYAEATNWANKLFEIAPNPGIKGAAYYAKHFVDFFQGKFEQALKDAEGQREMFALTNDELRRNYGSTMLGATYFAMGEYEKSQNAFKDLLSSDIGDTSSLPLYFEGLSHFYFGLLELKQHNLEEARAELEEMKNLLPQITAYKRWIEFQFHMLQAELFLAQGSVEKAISYCEKELLGKVPGRGIGPLGTYSLHAEIRDVLARAYYKNGELDKAINEYKRLVTFDPNSQDRLLTFPVYYYRLAKLYEEKGWEGKAIEHYEKFLDLWKDADPGIAEVEDAKNSLAGLKSQ